MVTLINTSFVTDLVTLYRFCVDTVNLKISAENAGVKDLQHTTLNYLSDYVNCQPKTGDDFVMGRIGNLKVIVKRQSLTISKGSLTKWLKGDNLEMLNRNDTRLAIEKLSDYLHLPIHKADVTRLDYAINFSIKNPLAIYLPYMQNNGRYRRLEQDKGIYYKMRDRELCLYDKIAEMKSKREYIPNIYAGNVGRLEKRYLKNLPSYFNRDAITAELLYNENFYKVIVQDLFKDYNSICKKREFSADLSGICTISDMYQMGLLALIEKVGGNNEMLNELSKNKSNKTISRKQYFDLKKTVLECSTSDLITSKNDLIIELDKSIEDVISTFL